MSENQPSGPIFDIFLSYHYGDREMVKLIADLLRQRGIKVWLDVWELVPGRPWQEALESVIQMANAAALFVGPSGLGPWQEPEMRACLSEFVKRKLPVIPVLLPGIKMAPELPLFLKAFTWVDLQQGFQSGGIDRLIWGVTGNKSLINPTPNYSSPFERDLGEKLKLLLLRKSEMAIAGDDQKVVNSEILKLKRLLREGPSLKAGEFLGSNRFRLMDIIGDGGFGTVWRAFDMKMEEAVALKVLHSQYARSELIRQRFFRGAKQMAKLRHPHIVPVIEPLGMDEGFFYFVMELVVGTDFQRLLLANGYLTTEEVVRIITLVGKGLEHAHVNGAIHRDVKPSNILVGENGRVKLTDFDLVKDEETTGGTRTGALGTYIFAAPELLSQAKSVDKQVDVYGLAMTAIFGLYGKELPPTIFRDPLSIIESLKCTNTVKSVLAKGTEWEVRNRYQNVSEFCDDLNDAICNPEGRTKRLITLHLKKEYSKNIKPFFQQKEGTALAPEARAKRPTGSLLENKSYESLDPIYRPYAVIGPEEWSFWVCIKPETFKMGNEQSKRDVEKPAHLVQITKVFWVGRFQITNEEYFKFISAGGYQEPSFWVEKGWKWLHLKGYEFNRWFKEQKEKANGIFVPHKKNMFPTREPLYWRSSNLNEAKKPVVGINWFEAVAYCRWLTHSLNQANPEWWLKEMKITLPTEAQWELSARGKEGRIYPWGNSTPDTEKANFNNNVGATSYVGQYSNGASPEGVMDLAGNVWEWCWDCWDDEAYVKDCSVIKDPVIMNSKPARAVRGGSWYNSAYYLRTTCRNGILAGDRCEDQGFRCVLTAGASSHE